jgi:hypothetical protein
VECISIGKQKVVWIPKLREHDEEAAGNALRLGFLMPPYFDVRGILHKLMVHLFSALILAE